MDLSALIFVALAIAWAAYLVPKALKYHEDGASSRSVDRFSHRMRVLARREPVDSRRARLVVQPGRSASSSSVSVKPKVGAEPAAEVPAAPVDAPLAAPLRTPSPQARRAAARRAAQRRRRVLGVLLVFNLLVAGLAIGRVVHPGFVAIPVVLLVAWLVACRLMVRRERGIGRSVAPRSAPVVPAAEAPAYDPDLTADVPVVFDEDAEPVAPVESPVAAPGMWDPVPVTLPTYVAKPPAARRTVGSIDLDSTGVWTSGRTEADASLAREAEEAARAARARREADGGRALGS